MSTRLVNMTEFRKRKSKTRVFEALEYLYEEVLLRLEDERGEVDPRDLEEFMIQILGDHLTGDLDSIQDKQVLNERYQRFDERLRKCLKTKLKSLSHFERIQKR